LFKVPRRTSSFFSIRSTVRFATWAFFRQHCLRQFFRFAQRYELKDIDFHEETHHVWALLGLNKIMPLLSQSVNC